MIKREEVEKMLAAYSGSKPGELRYISGVAAIELLHTWLAVDSAPIETLHHFGGGLLAAAELVLPEVWSELDGQRVKLVLVPEADSGGDRG